MANPYTAVNAVVSLESVNEFLNDIMTSPPELYTVNYVSNGAFGAVFRISVDTSIQSPFNTFFITPDRLIPTSVEGNQQRFCCKIVPINSDEQALSFTNECKKQEKMYAKTNYNFNAVCLPLFFNDIVDMADGGMADGDNPLKWFLNLIKSTLDSFPVCNRCGIIFMPFVQTLPVFASQPGTILSASEALLNTIESYRTIIANISELGVNISELGVIDHTHLPERIIHIFQQYPPYLYSYVSIVSLLIRSYLTGFCHGDLHLGNVVGCPYPSGITFVDSQRIDFVPLLLMIDMGFAHPHSNPIPVDIKTNYNAFKGVIDHIIRRNSKFGLNMLTHTPRIWFPKILMDQHDTEFTLNDNRLRVIFVLLHYFDIFRSTLEQQQLTIFNRIAPAQLVSLRAQNDTISASVVAYMRNELTGNVHVELAKGGRRHHRYYYQYARKQTKINKNSSNVRRRKSQKQRRRKSIHSKRCRK
jgi:hypothetical protein